jgi:hypothetical protein
VIPISLEDGLTPLSHDPSSDDDFVEAHEAIDNKELEFLEIRHLLPTTIRNLDLLVLPLSFLPDCCAFPLLILDEYETMENIFNMGLKGRSGTVFLMGQPSIGMRLGLLCKSSDLMVTPGKTSFLYVLLIKWLLHSQPTFFQTIWGNVFCASHFVWKILDLTAEVNIKDLQDPSDVVALVDADGEQSIHRPHPLLMHSLTTFTSLWPLLTTLKAENDSNN